MNKRWMIIENDPLVKVLKETHIAAAMRPNASTQILQGSWQMNGNDLIKSITAAMMSFGGRHAPIKDAYNIIDGNMHGTKAHVLWSGKIPGFGSAFVKGEFDPLLRPIQKELANTNTDYNIIAQVIHDYLKLQGKT